MKKISEERNGWIRLWRKLHKKRIWEQSTSEHKVIMITLLLMVCYEPEESVWNGNAIMLKPGSIITSLEDIKTQAGKDISIQNIRSALDSFENKYEFIKQEATKVGRLITILNWKEYQHDGETVQQSEQQRENAEKLYHFYIEKIEPVRKTKVRAIANILKHSKKYSFKDLARAVVNYKSTVITYSPEYRKDPANFFGVNETFFKDYLPENFQKQKDNINVMSNPPILTDERIRELNA